ncbi:MAG: FAD-dependent oxidoreductase [Armatimonadetes bacterium]|nr:FAD-dependent oxidoreductase [Armatimonadota bacterium]
MPATYQAAVIGGGINGLCAAYHFVLKGFRKVLLVEQYPLLHTRGSSHGKTRMTCAADPVRDYVELHRVAHQQEWPRLERDCGGPLIHPGPGILFGAPGAGLRSWFEQSAQAGSDVQWLEPADARRRFPQFRFADAEGVVLERPAGVIAAERTMRNLVAFLGKQSVDLWDSTRVLGIAPGDPIELKTSRGTIAAEHLVVAAGPWAGRLIPQLHRCLTPLSQVAGFFSIQAPPEAVSVGSFPCWTCFGVGEEHSFYGLPGLEGGRIEAVRDTLDGHAGTEEQMFENEAPVLRHFLERELALPLGEEVVFEKGFVTASITDDVIVDVYPAHPRIAFTAGCMGRGFKFAPLTGRLLVELAVAGKTEIPEFEQARERFALSRAVALAATESA